MSSLIQTLLEDLDTLGSKMASNLTSIGINSTANEGLTTLSNKITNVPVRLYHNKGDNLNQLIINSGVSCTTDGEYITVTTSTSGEKYIRFPFVLLGNWEFSCQIDITSFNNQALGWNFKSGGRYFAVPTSTTIYSRLSDSAVNITGLNITNDDYIKVQYIDGHVKLLLNDTVLQDVTYTVNYDNHIELYTNQNRVQRIKNITIKSL